MYGREVVRHNGALVPTEQNQHTTCANRGDGRKERTDTRTVKDPVSRSDRNVGEPQATHG
jgi:hypothetical protein